MSNEHKGLIISLIAGTYWLLSISSGTFLIQATIISHLDYLTDVLTGLPASPFPQVLPIQHLGIHSNYKCDHVTPLLKTIQGLLRTTKTTQNNLWGPEKSGHVSPLQVSSITMNYGSPNCSPTEAPYLAQTILILTQASFPQCYSSCLEHASLTSRSDGSLIFPSTADFSFTTNHHTFSYLFIACLPD